ncbi:hypothetical protein ACY3NT_003154 [Enterobacter sichuanensis]
MFLTGKRSPYRYFTRWLDEFINPALADKLCNGASCCQMRIMKSLATGPRSPRFSFRYLSIS